MRGEKGGRGREVVVVQVVDQSKSKCLIGRCKVSIKVHQHNRHLKVTTRFNKLDKEEDKKKARRMFSRRPLRMRLPRESQAKEMPRRQRMRELLLFLQMLPVGLRLLHPVGQTRERDESRSERRNGREGCVGEGDQWERLPFG